MRIEIIGKNYVVGEKLKNIIEKKCEKLDRYFNNSNKTESNLSSYIEKDNAVIKFICSQEKNRERYTMEATIYFGDRIIRAEETSDNMYNNIDLVIPKLERQVRKYRTKLEKQIKAVKEIDNGCLEDEENHQPQLKAVKTKKFELKPLSLEGAIDELELLDHDFFIYLNDETGKVNVVYKRIKGNVGVIECIY